MYFLIDFVKYYSLDDSKRFINRTKSSVLVWFTLSFN